MSSTTNGRSGPIRVPAGLPDGMQRTAGTNAISAPPDLMESIPHNVTQAFAVLSLLNNGQDRRNIYQRLSAYRTQSEALMDAYQVLNNLCDGMLRDNAQLAGGGIPEQAGRRWTVEQDNMLVEMVCQESDSMVQVALAFNRTPAAISSRLTYLVGVSKVSRHVVGRLTGYLDGEPVNGVFDGELRPHGK